MNYSINILLLVLATSLVVTVSTKSVPTLVQDRKKKSVSPSLPPVTATEKVKVPQPEENDDTEYHYYDEDKKEGSGNETDYEYDDKKDDDLDYVDQEEEHSKKEHEHTEDEHSHDVTEKKKDDYEEDDTDHSDQEEEHSKKEYEHTEDEHGLGVTEKKTDNDYDYEVHSKKKPDPLTTESEGKNECPIPYCADPEVGEDGCEHCDNSSCLFRGCVTYGAFFPTWKPDSCTFCVCVDGQEECTVSECGEEPDCHGYPSVTKPGQCCPECDYGIQNNDCGLIPSHIQSLYVSLGDYSCQTEVLMHKCDKKYFYSREEDAYYLCNEGEGVHQIEMSDKCESHIHEVTYTDVKECEKKKASFSEVAFLIPFDYSPPSEHCALYVPVV